MSYQKWYGDTPLHVGAAIVGAGINVYNNWDKIVKNPRSAIGYAATGAIAGAATLSPGGAVAAAKITAVGNFATDAVSGNIPDINSVEDAFGYVANSAMNALDVAGAGKLAKAGLNGLGKLGVNYLPDVAGNMATNAAADVADPMMIEWLSGWEKYADGVTIVASRSYTGQFSTASLFKTGASAALGVHGNSKSSMQPQHRYKIFDNKSGEVLEAGVSGQNINANGTSPRALQKINTKYPNTPNVDSRVVIKNVLGRAKILKWEKNKVDALRRNGLNLWKQFRPK